MKIRKYWMVYLAAVLLVVFAFLQHVASGGQYLPPVRYGQAFTLYFNVYDSNLPHRFYTTAPASADIHVYQDGTSMENPTNSVTDLGNTFSLVLTAAEMQAAVVIVEVNDNMAAEKLFMDETWIIPTYGDTLALNAFDLDDAIPNADIQAVDGNEAGAANMLTVYGSTNFLVDFNITSKMWNGDVYYIRGEAPGSYDTLYDIASEANDAAQLTWVAVDAMQPDVGDIKAVTDVLGVDWTDGGRLDLLLDTAAAATAEIAAVQTAADGIDANLALVLADTGELQMNQGNWLTATGFATTAEIAAVQTAADGIDANLALVLADTNELQARAAWALASTALSSATWTNTKAGYLDMAISDVNGTGGGVTYLVNTTVADGNSTTMFTLAAGSPNDLEYLNHVIVVIDADDPNRASERRIINYTGATKQVTVDRELTFTPAAGDTARIVEGGYSTGSFGFGRLIDADIFSPKYTDFIRAVRRRNQIGTKL